MTEPRFKTEQDFRKYLDNAIRESEKSTPQYPICESLLESYLSTSTGENLFYLTCSWDNFVKPYLRRLREDLSEDVELREDRLETQLSSDHNLRKKVSYDLEINSVYDDKGKIRKEALDHLHEEFSDPRTKIAIAYKLLQEIDKSEFNNFMRDNSSILLDHINELVKDDRMVIHLFYASIARRIMKLYVDPIYEVSIDR